MAGPVLLDLCCGAGGAATGYARAGFRVVGVDIALQRRYPFEFHQADALDVLEDMLDGLFPRFHAIHASFPCQAFSQLGPAATGSTSHGDLITPGRKLLEATGLPYVIENVERAPLKDPVIFCGPSFGLEVVRHRGFEANWPLTAPPCSHKHGGVNDGLYVAFYPSRRVRPGRRLPPRRSEREYRAAMGVEWMTMRQMRQAVPPAYTHHIGTQLMSLLSFAATGDERE